MTPEHIQRLHAFWADAYGFDTPILEQPGFSLVVRESLESPIRVVVFRTATHALVFTPPSLAVILEAHLASFEGRIVTARDVQAALGTVETTLGNVDLILYYDDTQTSHQADRHVRPLTNQDGPALDDLNAAVSEQDRALGRVSLEDDVVLGWFDDDQLLGAASLVVENAVADVGVLARSQARGRGVGRALVAALVTEGVERGWLVQYTTLERNASSVKVAEATGFVRFAVEEAVRIIRASS